MNIAEILKNCPKGTKLYSPIFGEVEFGFVSPDGWIKCYANSTQLGMFYPDGTYSKNGEVMLFPSKEQRDWNQFLIPFKDGDVIITTDMTDIYPYENIAIFKEYEEKNFKNKMIIHCQFDADGDFLPGEMDVLHRNWRLANQEEKDNFFKKMAEVGYYWTGDKLVKQFVFGDIVAMYNTQYQHTHIAIFDKYVGDKFMKVVCTNLADSNIIKIFGEGEHWNKQDVRYATEEEKKFFFNLLKEQGYAWTGKELVKRFDLGDTITDGKATVKITSITENFYSGYDFINSHEWSIPICRSRDWKLAKFDLCSLKPYDKVLVKTDTGCWYPTLVSYVESPGEVYLIDTTDRADCVIPFEGNEYLIGKWDDPDPYYITWE